MDFLLITLLILLNAAFAMSELALASSRKARLTTLAEAGDRGAQAALKLLESPTEFLSSVQVGITSIGMLNGILGEAAYSDEVAAGLQALGVPASVSGWLATVLVVTLITYITIVFGELVPKRIGQMYPEAVARWVARPMVLVAQIAQPFVRCLTWSTETTLHLLRLDQNQAQGVTEAEISASLEEGLDAGVIEQHEHQMVHNVFRLDDRTLTSLMLPRTEIQWLEASDTAAACLKKISDSERTADPSFSHSWYPVCRGSLDDVVGLISVAKLLTLNPKAQEAIEGHTVPAAFLPETLTGMELLAQFRGTAARMVLVVDEYGVVQGLMTPRDLLEAITGELQPAQHTEAWALPLPQGRWELDGLMPIEELKARLEIDELPEENKGRYNTLAGLLMFETGHLPVTQEKISCAGWSFEVLSLEGRRIDKVLAMPNN